jgi:ComF family protein
MSSFQKIRQFILDILFPIECLGCKKEDVWLCQDCLKKIPIKTQAVCPICRKNTDGSVCPLCKKQTALDGVLTTTKYEQPLIQQAIRIFKYSSIPALADPLAAMLIKRLALFDKNNIPAILQSPSNTVIIPVPLHKKRRLERGFNQSELLANQVSRRLNIVCQPNILHRMRYTAAQAKLEKHERESNLRGAFAVTASLKNSPKNVILIDDVATTLSTLTECATVLKQAGCQEVWGLVIARGN